MLYSVKSVKEIQDLNPFIVVGCGGGGEKFSNLEVPEGAQRDKAPEVLLPGMDVGAVEKTGHLPPLRLKLAHRHRRVGRAADMKHHAPRRHGNPPFFEQHCLERIRIEQKLTRRSAPQAGEGLRNALGAQAHRAVDLGGGAGVPVTGHAHGLEADRGRKSAANHLQGHDRPHAAPRVMVLDGEDISRGAGLLEGGPVHLEGTGDAPDRDVDALPCQEPGGRKSLLGHRPQREDRSHPALPHPDRPAVLEVVVPGKDGVPVRINNDIDLAAPHRQADVLRCA